MDKVEINIYEPIFYGIKQCWIIDIENMHNKEEKQIYLSKDFFMFKILTQMTNKNIKVSNKEIGRLLSSYAHENKKKYEENWQGQPDWVGISNERLIVPGLN